MLQAMHARGKLMCRAWKATLRETGQVSRRMIGQDGERVKAYLDRSMISEQWCMLASRCDMCDVISTSCLHTRERRWVWDAAMLADSAVLACGPACMGLQLTGRPVRVLRMKVGRVLVVWQVWRSQRSGGLRRCVAEMDLGRVRSAAETALDRGQEVSQVVGGIRASVCFHASSTLGPGRGDVSSSSRPIPDA